MYNISSIKSETDNISNKGIKIIKHVMGLPLVDIASTQMYLGSIYIYQFNIYVTLINNELLHTKNTMHVNWKYFFKVSCKLREKCIT